MGDMVGSIAGSAVDFLLQNLISLCAEEISLIRNFNKDLGKLKESLDMIQSFLNDAEKKQVKDEAVRLWLKKLEAVAFDANNVLDELSYEVLRNKIETETGNKIKKKVRKCFWIRKMGRKIRNIKENLKSINQEATDFGLQRQLRAHAPNFVSDTSRETDSYSVDPSVFGREDYVSRIVEILTSNNSTHDEQQVFSVLPIDGMGRLGKTTIARSVFNDERITKHFDELIWVYVSRKFDANDSRISNDLFKKILESLTKQKVDPETKDAILGKIQENLQNKKYLLVLDDVWTDETKKWGDFQETLKNISSVKGNGIIITTRSKDVASMVGTIPNIPELSKLSDEECWSIIKRKAFRRCVNIRSEFETIGRKIAERCQGLPLAANVLGGLLYGKSKEEWHSIEGTRLSDLGEDGNSVMNILKLSFDNLSSQSLKKCFAFCSIFPKGHEIEKDMLIYLWMAEGFLHGDQGNGMETVGQKYIHLFLQNSLLQNLEEDEDGNTLYCKMHDLVHDLASSVSHESGPVRFMYMNSDREISKEEAENLHSLIIYGKVPENTFVDLKCLRGLVLIGGDKKELPKLEHLIHLRYLDVSSAAVEYLPKSIGNLYHLQTLRASNYLNEIPKTLKKLINLRHLHILKSSFQFGHESKIEELPMLGHLPHLKSLYFNSLPKVRSIGASADGIHNESVGEDKIIVFPALKSLSLSSMSSMTELLTVGESQLDCEMVAFPHLESLKLDWCQELSSGPSHFPCLKELKIDTMNISGFLENLLLTLTSLTRINISNVEELACLPDMFFSNNQHLSYLKIDECDDLKHLSPSFGPSLREIEILECENLEELPNNLHCLHSLERLQIKACLSLKSIPYNPSNEGHEPIQGFPLFRELNISYCDSLSELPSGMIELCTSLEIVHLLELPNVRNLVEVIGCLPKMPHLSTLGLDLSCIPKSDSNNFPIVLIGSLRNLRDLAISCKMKNWEGVQDQLEHLINLRCLRLSKLEIEALPEWLGNLSSLRELRLFNCPNLKSLPSKEAMKHLTELWIWACPLLNVRSDDGNSEWHKISHISYVNVYPEQTNVEGDQMLKFLYTENVASDTR